MKGSLVGPPWPLRPRGVDTGDVPGRHAGGVRVLGAGVGGAGYWVQGTGPTTATGPKYP